MLTESIVKEQFPLLCRKVNGKKLIYLDNAATSLTPSLVIKAMEEYYQKYNANVHRGIYKISEEATSKYEEARKKVADFINASPKEIIFTKSATEGFNLLAYSFTQSLKEGDEIIISEMEHHSNLVPWQQLAKKKGLILRYWELKNEDLNLKDLKELINEKTKIISIVYISNVLGTINPIKEIVELAHQVNAVCIVDAAQSVPHMLIDVKELDCDFLVFSGHKMCGPTGVGVVYGKFELLNKMEPFLYGGDMIKDVNLDNSSWNEVPWKFEAGTPPIAEVIGLGAAVDYLKEVGMENIKKHDQELVKYALMRLNLIEGIKVFGPSERGPVISFNLEGIEPHDLAALLDKEGIAIRAGSHCAMPLVRRLGVEGTCRISLYLYNTKEEIDFFIEALEKLQSGMLKILANKDFIKENFSEEEEIYKENILDHYKHPKNYGKLDNSVITHHEVNHLCGDRVELYLNIKDEKISEIKFTGKGCAISMASASMLTEFVKNKEVQEIKELNPEVVFNLLGIDVGIVRQKCALLPLKALHKGLETWR